MMSVDFNGRRKLIDGEGGSMEVRAGATLKLHTCCASKKDLLTDILTIPGSWYVACLLCPTLTSKSLKDDELILIWYIRIINLLSTIPLLWNHLSGVITSTLPLAHLSVDSTIRLCPSEMTLGTKNK
jgi:hypothetical protein